VTQCGFVDDVKHLKLDFVALAVELIEPIGIVVWKWRRAADRLGGVEQITRVITLLCHSVREPDQGDRKNG
jgi:hypothetical protein